jgi:lipopolysaccharide biosynthesis regulator YciM
LFIEIIPSYENVKNIQEWVTFLFENIKKKNIYDLEDKIYDMIIEKYNKKQFNKALIESVSEKPML